MRMRIMNQYEEYHLIEIHFCFKKMMQKNESSFLAIEFERIFFFFRVNRIGWVILPDFNNIMHTLYAHFQMKKKIELQIFVFIIIIFFVLF